MGLEITFTSKKEVAHMKKFVLTGRVIIHVDRKTGKERLANMGPKVWDKDSTFLLGGAGFEIPMERALALGLVKVEKEVKE